MPSLLQAQAFYTSDSVQQIEISFDFSNWDYRLDTAKAGAGNYTMASVKINGSSFDSVGVKYKGNSSYSESNGKNPFHIELNTYKNQSYQSYTDIKLSNGYGDPSLIREVMAYKIAGNYLKGPSCALAKVYVNNVYIGLYSSAESINNGFVARNFYGEDNTFVKCNPTITPGPAVKSNLKYLGEDSLAYYNYYELQSTHGWKDLIALCKYLPISDSLPSYINAESSLWMLAFNNLFINLDAYSGAFAQNYYLYKDQNNRFNPILWDLNMCFGSFPFAGSPNNGMGSLSVTNRVQFSPSYHDTHADWPLIQSLLSNPNYLKKYYAHYKTLLQEIILSGYADSLADNLLNIAAPHAYADTNKFFVDTAFAQSLEQTVTFGSYQVPGIKYLLRERANYLKTLPEFSVQQPIFDSLFPIRSEPNQTSSKVFKVRLQHATGASVYYQTSREKLFEELSLFDDGLHNDEAAGDGIFGNSAMLAANHFSYYYIAQNTQAVSYLPQGAPHQIFTFGAPSISIGKGSIVINEILAKNNKSDINDYGIYTDWFELYNTTNDTLNLYGTYVSDKSNNPYKFAIQAGAQILPHNFLGIWADNLPSKTFIHANLNLSSAGESLILYNKNGEVLDKITFETQQEDISLARCPDGANYLTPMQPPSFMASNNRFCVSGLNTHQPLAIQLYPNPATQKIYLKLPENIAFEGSIYNIFGQLEQQQKMRYPETEIDIETLKPGIYFIQFSNRIPALKFIKNP